MAAHRWTACSPKEDHGFNYGGSPEATAETWRLTLDFLARRLQRAV